MGFATRLVSVLVLLAAWQLAASAAGSRLLPAPLAILDFIVGESATGDLWRNVGITLARVGISFLLAMTLGVLLGIALGRWRRLNLVLDTPLLILLNTPALVITVLAYIWVGLNEAAAIVAVVLNKLPNVAVILREGARGLDPQLEEMARTYRFDRRTWIAHVLVPQLQPFVVAAARSGLSLAWKIVLVIELLGRPERRRLRHQLLLRPEPERGGDRRLQHRLHERDDRHRHPHPAAARSPCPTLALRDGSAASRGAALRVEIARKVYGAGGPEPVEAVRDLAFSIGGRDRLPDRPVGGGQDHDPAHPARPRPGL